MSPFEKRANKKLILKRGGLPYEGMNDKDVLCDRCLDPVRETIDERRIIPESLKKKGLKQLIIGVIAMGIPSLIFIGTYYNGSITHVAVFYGAFFYGLYMVIKGLINLAKHSIRKNHYKTLVESKID